ncbi:phage holin family protein [Enterobacter kobei]|uniref:phage holin family protein n=1 Tax=Enterobacter kobei TaxID=208224 RepID=UPI000C1EB919|nr:phage holin family protein [Enterobacter kobei]MBT1799352.1 phage holin family protein [Enterobacter kobei]MCK6863236.1 phage holin family protein [Enterobacter kobei]MCO7419533.1 phage holin family protein [Enterobacter kobei]PJD37561.1 holin [Enterobacter kobei]PJD43352.1 holin [Enterobacter kobei]
MQEYEKGALTLAVMGALIALGKLLSSNEPVTARLAIGRVIVGSALSVAAGSMLYLVPELHPLALLGIGSALGLAGLQGVELWLKRKGINAGAGKL